MKLRHNILNHNKRAGFSLIECICYIAVFLILSSVAIGAFYLCWDHSKALIAATDDVGAALSAGERWRADIRAATGTIRIETTGTNEVVTIPEGEKDVIYTFDSKQVQRQIGSGTYAVPLLPQVMSSEMKPETRGSVTAWRWELQVAQRRKETHLPLLFTFEAVPGAP